MPDGKGGFTIMLEGNFWPSIPGPSDSRLGKPPGQDEATGADNHYSLPYRAIVPKRGTGANVLVPVCLSASAVAYSSTRIETMCVTCCSPALSCKSGTKARTPTVDRNPLPAAQRARLQPPAVA